MGAIGSTMRRVVKYAVLILFPALVLSWLTSWFPFTLLIAHPEQDECAFGPVTNAEYRAMLSKALSLRKGRSLSSNPPYELSEQFLEVSQNSSSPYVKIAAMHAVLRALDANFRNISLPVNAVFDRASKTGGTISYHYSLAVPRIGVPALPGNAWFIGSLKGPQPSTYTSRIPYRQGEVYFTAHFPNPVDQIPNVLWQGSVSCPPVPPKELESFFAG
jgi:hypothetical protein